MKLNKGEVICPECNGEGFYKHDLKKKFLFIKGTLIYDELFRSIKNIEYLKICNKCMGEGKLDWTDNLINKITEESIGLLCINKTYKKYYILYEYGFNGKINKTFINNILVDTIYNSLICETNNNATILLKEFYETQLDSLEKKFSKIRYSCMNEEEI